MYIIKYYNIINLINIINYIYFQLIIIQILFNSFIFNIQV